MQSLTDGSANPRLPPLVAKRTTASSLLAKFLPKDQPLEHKMVSIASKRNSSANLLVGMQADSKYSTPMQKPQNTSRKPLINLADDDEDEIQYAEKKLSTSRGLRSHSTSSLSQKTVTQVIASRKNTKSTMAMQGYQDYDELSLSPLVSDRVAVRQEIATTTLASRNRFLVENKDFFLPLLPENNSVKKLVERHEALDPAQKALVPATIQYEELQDQPKGVQATMKPYQLSGLSFMLYLHRNGLSGILGDEMGLGKTLQTLSLIQYLKENEPKTGHPRPFLVVCPLSVLSSWMTEAKKWTPQLKVLRFHGPTKERDRLKKVAIGETDMRGNMTSKAKAKFNTKRTANGKPIISLDSDTENEDELGIQTSSKARSAIADEAGVDLVVTTYESFLIEQGWFKRVFVWRYVVLDEGHKLKNDMSLISRSLQGLKAEYRLILTGTPLQNNLGELWALLHWLYQDVFVEKSADLFRDSFNLSKGLFSNTVVDDARHLLELIMLRRMKNSPGVNLNLPPKTEVLLFVPLSPMQRFWYTRLITRADQSLLDELFRGARQKEQVEMMKENEPSEDGVVGSGEWEDTKEILAQTIERENNGRVGDQEQDSTNSSAWRKLMNLLMQLRKVCNHPYQIRSAEPVPYEVGEHIIRASGKFIVLDKLVKELVVKQKKKILIFSGFTNMLDLVEEFLSIRGGDGSLFRSVRLDGGTGRARRNLGIRMFNDTSSDYRVMLISTRAGGLGINLATASDVVMLDQDWNPQITLQAEARAHRIGQTKPVTIYKLVSQGTVEEQMMGRIQKKLYLSAKVTDSMQDIHTNVGKATTKTKKGPGGRVVDDDDMIQLNTGQLMALVRRGASAISRPEVDVSEMLSWDWETTVAKCKDQPADMYVKKDAIPDAVIDEDAEQKWLSEMERVEAYVFEGQRLARAGKRKGPASYRDIANEFNRADRRIGKNTTVMVDGFAVNKESMNCKDWEAVPTMAGRDPTLAEPKRPKKAAIISQSHCQVCLDGGDLHCCQLCPRAYHYNCLDAEFQAKTKALQFNCPQHQCADCEQKTTDAGGMLYRCRWCERAFCEDCLEWEKTTLLGENLLEYELLGYEPKPQAFYIQCPVCDDHFQESVEDKAYCDAMANDVADEHKRVFYSKSPGSCAGSLSDGTTIETPGIGTPGLDTPVTVDSDMEILSGMKRKLEIEPNDLKLSRKHKRIFRGGSMNFHD